MSTWDDKPNDYEHALAVIERLKRDHIGAHRISLDTIRRLEAEIERLRAALLSIEMHELRDHEDYEAIKDIAARARRENEQLPQEAKK